MFRIPFSFIATGIVSFMLFHLLTGIDFAGWMSAAPRSPEGWFQVHLLVLGWATMIAMGAVYQLLNVVLQNESYSVGLGFVHYGLFTAGTTGLLLGFRFLETAWIAAFATLACAGILVFAWNIGRTLLRAKQWNSVTISTACAVGWLVLTAVSGLLMGTNFQFNYLGLAHERLFGTHIWFGAIGWFGLLITGFSYKLLPMFYLSHDYPLKLERWIIVLWNGAVVFGAAGFLFGSRLAIVAALAQLSAAVILYNRHITAIASRKHKRTPGAGIAWAVWSSRGLIGLSAAALIVTAFPPAAVSPERLATAGLWAYLYGWVALTIMAYLSKIAPFLWWTYKYGPRAGKGQVPTMGQLLAEQPIHIGLSAVTLYFIVLLAGIAAGIGPVIAFGGVLLSAAAMLYMVQIAYVFTR